MIKILFTLVHVLVAFFLIAVVLLQTGKRADLAGAFGGGGSQTAFGARGAASALTKFTTVAAALFMLTSLSLAFLGSNPEQTGGGGLEELEGRVGGAVTEPAPETDSDIGLPALPPVDSTPAGDAGATDSSDTATPEGDGSDDADDPGTTP